MTEQAKRAGAIQLRQNGATYQGILEQLGMAKSTLWRWLKSEGDICGIPREQLNLELCIHESGNIVAAQHFWASALQVPAEQFRIRLKRHTVAPHRRNTADGYVGLVRVTVRRSVALNRRIAGWIQGLCQSVGESANGKPSDFGSEYPGSIPGSPASDSTSLIHNFRV